VGETACLRIVRALAAVEKPVDERRLYWPPRRPPFGGIFSFDPLFSHEAHLSAERSPAEAQARLPRADGDPRRPRDPQAPPREGPRAPFGL